MSTNQEITKEPLKILFCGWTHIIHSYSVVMMFKMVALYKNYSQGNSQGNSQNSPKLKLYLEKRPYYNPNWKPKELNTIFNKEYCDIIDTFEIYDSSKHHIDLIYRVTFPYDITINNDNITIPKCVFYTSEYSVLDDSYFTTNFKKTDSGFIKKYLEQFKNIYFTAPSEWSAKGLRGSPFSGSRDLRNCYSVPDSRNKIITHGVDTSIFYPDKTNRNAIRSSFGVREDDILLINVGAMTGNKGIQLLLKSLITLRRTDVKLLLKGAGELYQSKQMLESYLRLFNAEEVSFLLSIIVFTDSSFNFDQLRDLYNASDYLVSPYIAEGFNLTPLEALACGLRVIVTGTGSTKEYIDDCCEVCGVSEGFITKIKSEVIKDPENRYLNNVDVGHLTEIIGDLKKVDVGGFSDVSELTKFINQNYSWSAVSHMLYGYFMEILG